jgi:hypothetical protein
VSEEGSVRINGIDLRIINAAAEAALTLFRRS